jgi:hypothetical protein
MSRQTFVGAEARACWARVLGCGRSCRVGLLECCLLTMRAVILLLLTAAMAPIVSGADSIAAPIVWLAVQAAKPRHAVQP